MKKMLLISFIAALMVAGIARSNANTHQVLNMNHADEIALLQPTPESMAQRETEWMTTELKLSQDQITKVSAINVKYAQKMMEQFQGGPGGDREAMQAQMAQINAQKRSEFESLLSAEQLKKYDEYLAENQQRGFGGGGRGGTPPGQ